jgi:hypothetical protein
VEHAVGRRQASLGTPVPRTPAQTFKTAALSLRLRIRNTTSFKLETGHPPSQRTLFNLAQTPGNLATV